MSLRTASRNIIPFIAFAPAAAFIALTVLAGSPSPANAQDGTYTPEFTSDKKLKIPEGKIWRECPHLSDSFTVDQHDEVICSWEESDVATLLN